MMMMIFEGQRGKQALPVRSYTRNFEGSNNSRHPAAAGWGHTSKMSCLWLPSRATAETPVKPSLYRMYLSSSESWGMSRQYASGPHLAGFATFLSL